MRAGNLQGTRRLAATRRFYRRAKLPPETFTLRRSHAIPLRSGRSSATEASWEPSCLLVFLVQSPSLSRVSVRRVHIATTSDGSRGGLGRQVKSGGGEEPLFGVRDLGQVDIAARVAGTL
jgi:hypothetical protein